MNIIIKKVLELDTLRNDRYRLSMYIHIFLSFSFFKFFFLGSQIFL